MTTPRTAFDQAIEESAPVLEEVAETTLSDEAVQAALADESVDEEW